MFVLSPPMSSRIDHGKQRVANVGPQTKFPVPEGILDYSGKK